jgi:hypothetical protein
MLVDGGTVVNLMPYSVFKKLQLDENDLVKTNMVLSGFEGKEETEAKGVMSVELTVGSKTLATAFFIAEVQGNYNVISGQLAPCKPVCAIYFAPFFDTVG